MAVIHIVAWWSNMDGSAGSSGCQDSSQADANRDLSSFSASLSDIISKFKAKGLSARDMTVLSGAHTICQTACGTFRSHIYGDTDVDSSFAALRKQNCPFTGGDGNPAPLDLQTPNRFDNSNYRNVVDKKGLLHSDQELFDGGSQDSLARLYSTNGAAVARDFAAAMVKMGALSPLTGTMGEIRLNCRRRVT